MLQVMDTVAEFCTCRALRRADRRRRPLGHRRRLAPAEELPGQELRHPRGARGERRHVGSVPLSRRPLRLRHVHAGLPLPAVEGGQGDRRRPVDPELHPRGRERPRHRRQDPLPPPRGRRLVVDAGRTLDGRGRARAGRGAGTLHLQLPVDVQRLLPLRGGLPAGVPRHRALQGPDRPSAELDRRHRLRRQEGRRDRQRRHGGDAGAGDGGHGAEHVTMLQRSPTYMVARPAQDPIANKLRRRLPLKLAYARHALEERAARHVFLPDVQAQAGEGEEPAAGRRAPDAGAGLRRRHALHAALQSVGPAALPGARRRFLPRHPPQARSRSSPTRSRPSPRPASG